MWGEAFCGAFCSGAVLSKEGEGSKEQYEVRTHTRGKVGSFGSLPQARKGARSPHVFQNDSISASSIRFPYKSLY